MLNPGKLPLLTKGVNLALGGQTLETVLRMRWGIASLAAELHACKAEGRKVRALLCQAVADGVIESNN